MSIHRIVVSSFVAAAMMLGISLASTPVSAATDCSKTPLKFDTAKVHTYSACVEKAQQAMKDAGIVVAVDGYFGNGTMNAILNFQRQQGLSDDGVVGSGTWARLVSPRAVTTTLPKSCTTYTKSAPVTLCASQAQRKLFYLKNGKVVKTVAVRFGGWAYNPTTKKYQIYRTTKGTFSIPSSRKYKEYTSSKYDASMPYSMFFYGGEAVHYSSGFDSDGYTGASHGCVNVGSLSEAKWLFDNTPGGSKVVVY